MSYAIVTGASRGLGAGMAKKLAQMGYDVVVNYTSESSAEKAQTVADDIIGVYNKKALVVKADMSTLEGCEQLVYESREHFGDDIAVLINNAGIS